MKLLEHIKFNTTVTSVKKNDDGDWEVTLKRERKVDKVRKFDAVLVCNGHYEVPFEPILRGSYYFPGKITHSHDYKDNEDFKD